MSWANGYTFSNVISMGDLDKADLEVVRHISADKPLRVHMADVARMVDNSYPPMFERLNATFSGEISGVQRPDVVICDSFAPACLDAARYHNIPVISSHCTSAAGIHNGDPSGARRALGKSGPSTFSDRFWLSVLLPLGFKALPTSVHTLAMRTKLGFPPGSFFLVDAVCSVCPFRLFVFAHVVPQVRGVPVLSNSFWGFDSAAYVAPYVHVTGPVTHSHQPPLSSSPHLQAWLDDAAAAGAPVVLFAMGSMAIPLNPAALASAMTTIAQKASWFLLRFL
jgi:hypothetical protein